MSYGGVKIRAKPMYFIGWWLITLHSNITWLTLTHSLDGSGGKIKTLTLYSVSNHNPNHNHNQNHNQNPNTNEKFDFLP